MFSPHNPMPALHHRPNHADKQHVRQDDESARRVDLIASRDKSIWRINKSFSFRRNRFTVKKYVPPVRHARR